MTSYYIHPLQAEHALNILGWRYPAPYDFYDPPDDPHSDRYVREFMRPEWQFHVILDRENRMAGFCSFGPDGQVEGGDYSQPALDIGLGMKPNLTGQGLGKDFFTAILVYANTRFEVDCFRLTVANFNERAMSLYKKLGFRPVSEFTDTRNGVKYTILTGAFSDSVEKSFVS